MSKNINTFWKNILDKLKLSHYRQRKCRIALQDAALRVILSEENISGKCFRSRTLQNLRQIADFVKSKRIAF